MSQGHGWVQRKILETFEDLEEGVWCHLKDMTCHVFETDNPTKAQYKSVSRAVNRLEDEKLIKSSIWRWGAQHALYYQYRKNHPRWSKRICKL